jgi:fructan beta-fructosidase
MSRFIAIAAFAFLPLSVRAADDILIADFEGDTYGDWKTTGEAFGPGPARGTLPGQMPVSGFLGKGLVNSFYKGDGTTGTLTSPSFKIQRKYVSFLIGGGGHAGKTCMNLLLGGKVVRTATGPNTEPGGSEELDWHSWDVSDLMDKDVVIQIVDDHTGGWGHINIDHIVQSDAKKTSGPARREITIDKRYLHLPVRTGAPKRRMKLVLDGRTVREFDIELSDEPAFQVFADVSEFRGKTLTLEVNKLAEDSKSLANVSASDELPAAGETYREKRRPQFHFTSRRGWLNDPNGLVYFNGEYHLFYQHNPFGWNWDNMHWGHAVSKDLVHWRELPEALYPVKYGDWCFSGGAFVVKKGHAGFEQDTMVAAFTSTGRGECLTASNDGGRTWKELPGNPAVKHAGRDPKVIWHEPTKRWIMAVYDEFEGKRWIAFYSTPDLKKWTFESRIEGFFECPDLFELPVQQSKERKWVLYAADGKYVLGHFDGHEFKAEPGKHQLWYGNFYAAQTFTDTPDGRRIQIGWGNGITFPGMPFNQQMTVPVELTLGGTKEGVRMFAEPVNELATLHGERHAWKDIVLRQGENPLKDLTGDLFDIRTTFATNETVGFSLRGVPVIYNAKNMELSCGNVKAPLTPEDGRIRLRILLDRGSVELFANSGRVAMSVAAIPKEDNRKLEMFARGGTAKIVMLEVAELKSAWSEK